MRCHLILWCKLSQNSWVVPKMAGNKSTMLFKHWNNCLRNSSVCFLCSRTQTWHSEEWWLLCRESTLRKIFLNPRPQMPSNYSSLLAKMSCFILGLSRSCSVDRGWAAPEPGGAESRKAVAGDVSATSGPEAVQTSAGLHRQHHSWGKCPPKGRYWRWSST